ncbi:MAG: DMT family transporter [Thalassobaculum sp.]|uniref:DMT family transporter n=1 Tax=Thalassobaculum sp. TaxID=2022740 RepID=UPI0032EFF312
MPAIDPPDSPSTGTDQGGPPGTGASPPTRAAEISIDASLGIGLLVLAELVFATMDTVAKYLSQEMPVGMVVWGRYAFNFAFLLPFLLRRRPSEVLRVHRLGLVLFRGVQLLTATTCFFTAIRYIPLADAVAIGFVAPLFVVALSVPLLGERVGPRRWAAVLVGLAGTLVIVRPGFSEVHWAYGLVILLAFIFATFVINTRILTRTERPMAMLFYTTLVGASGATLILPFVWQTPTLAQWGLMAVMGALGGGSHLMLIHAYRVATASLLAPFQYAQIVFAGFFGWLVFGDLPDGWTLAGTAILVGSGLYVLHREAQVARPGG